MTRFNNFTNEELDAMEEAFCNEGLSHLVNEIRRERESIKTSKNDKRFQVMANMWGEEIATEKYKEFCLDRESEV